MYPSPLLLETEPEADSSEYDFLESKFLVRRGDVWVRLKSKNEGAVWHDQELCRLLPHPGSNRRRTRLMIVAALHRARSNSNYAWGAFLSGLEKVLEFWAAGHDLAWLADCVSTTTETLKTGDDSGCWQQISDLLECLAEFTVENLVENNSKCLFGQLRPSMAS